MTAIAAIAVLLAQSPASSAKPNLRGCVVVSSDPAYVARIRATPELFSPYEEAAKRLASARTEVRPWGDNYAVVLDRESGVLGWYHDRAVLLDAMIAKVGQDGLLRLSDLDAEQTKALANALPVRSLDENHRPIVPTAFAIHVSGRIVATRSGVSHTVRQENPDNDRADRALARELREAPARAHRTGEGPSPLSEGELRQDVRLTAIGLGHGLTESMEQTAPMIREIAASMREGNERRATRLMAKWGLGDTPVFAGALSRMDLPKEKWREYSDLFAGQWRAGFGSEEEARAFFEASDSIRLYTSIDIRQTIDPGDPERFRASSGMVQSVMTLPGVFGP